MTELLPIQDSTQLRAVPSRPTRAEAVTAIRTLLRWIGEDPEREGLLETPDRVLRAYGEVFAGYGQDPAEVLAKTFDETASYNGAVVVRDIEVRSHCEHHMVPFTGRAPTCPTRRSLASASSRAWSTATRAACRSRSA